MTEGIVPYHVLIGFAVAFSGWAFGLAYFAVLRRTAMLFATRPGFLTPSALTLGRILAAAALLAFAARLGAVALLAAFLGFLLARTMALRATPREP